MNNFELFIVELLKDHITLDGNIVEVRREFSPIAHVPCITLDLPGDTTMFREVGLDEVSHHVHVDGSVNIHSWCNTEEERESINTQIRRCFHRACMHDYTYCTQYEDGTCKSTGGSCLVNSSLYRRGLRRRCPSPWDRGYESLMVKHGICDGTLDMEPCFFMDEEGEHPPLLHSVFRCTCEYVDSYSLDFDDDFSPFFDGVDEWNVEVD